MGQPVRQPRPAHRPAPVGAARAGVSTGTPLFPPRRDFLDYLHEYAETFRLPIETSSEVMKIEHPGDRWIVRLRNGTTLESRTIVVATGIVANPQLPEIPGRSLFPGRVIHSAEYRRPAGTKGRRVLVVGAGNSAGEISVELVRAGAEVTLAVRTGATIVPRDMLGIPIQYLSVLLHPLPRTFVQHITTAVGRLRGPRVLPPPPPTTCPKVPLIGLALAEALRARTIRLRGGLTTFTAEGVRFDDGSELAFDDVILATGYRAALGFLESGDPGRLLRVWAAARPRREPRPPGSLLRRPQLRHTRRPLQHLDRRRASGARDYASPA